MEQRDLIVKTAKRIGVSEHTAADVLEAAETIKAEEPRGGQSPSTKSARGEGVAQSEPADQAASSDDASEQAAVERALKKAEAAFGRQDESDSSRRTYSERSGLLV
ncbi:MAG TPA: hypothetical protein VG053_01435 [Solirubrobacteraceae bacterium]|jgi:hypothetical protein|nr:hypothetical protein [Solirubrobacteraceae bacterium]